ncbi:hypothetical protein ABS71_07840 [bacterium SCN 62-11]|nr:hypothetical protein [Candidatus Eremiobacteraeota bacterium]ODT72258.1 MAG: hypothetical protein ABS71_07840 [bacterium SCN 62-11]
MLSTFVLSLAVLTFLRCTRKVAWLCFLVSVLLSALTTWFSFVHYRWIELPPIEPRYLYTWLSACAWVTLCWGTRDPCWSLLLVPSLFSNAGLTGIFTGLALNLPLPRRKPAPERENFGIYRHA